MESERLHPLQPAPFLQGKEWRVSPRPTDAGSSPGGFQEERWRHQSGFRQL